MNKNLLIIILAGLFVLVIAAYFFGLPAWRKYKISKIDNETKRFVGPQSTWEKIQVELKDIQGLEGGRHILINGSGLCQIEIVNPKTEGNSHPLFSKKYEFTLEKQIISEIVYKIIENDLVKTEIADRPGVPDEARPEIVLTSGDGERFSVAKWILDSNQQFDKIYSALLKLEKKTKNLTPVSEEKWEGYKMI